MATTISLVDPARSNKLTQVKTNGYSKPEKRKRSEAHPDAASENPSEHLKKKAKKKVLKTDQNGSADADHVPAPSAATVQAASAKASQSRPAETDSKVNGDSTLKRSKKMRNHESGENDDPVTVEPSEKKVKPSRSETVRVEEKPTATALLEKPKKKRKKEINTTLDVGPATAQIPDETVVQDWSATQPKGTDGLAHRQLGFSDEILAMKSPFEHVTASLYLALSPCANDFPVEGLLAEHLSPLLLTYYPPLKGVVLSYTNARISNGPNGAGDGIALGQSIDEYAVTFLWLTADFLLFKPSRDAYLEGCVNLQNESLLGLICYNYFNAGIDRSRLPTDWSWKDNDDVEGVAKWGRQPTNGHWVDGDGVKVEGRLAFRVRDFEAVGGSELGAGSVNILGTLLSDDEDGKLDDEERQQGLVTRRSR
ncbi:hypothetical protein BAUCODRAFT_31494 [Baudoinia panamericana UAMH 10762]|uniref:DNA-directed RNA polymerase subunit n=1 Tax=Baudoinia panamericana (strain UAMH 10762) TaxID=717646 RepID=M2LWW5_BAUPA|nr:uncharacterized protein BAUCODRAFT_31494 [Baudoinia panamericana UAMH 10762]EMC99172.1 hypothetical protein BAUCODRAFT_31494 [Baudoinia panamericana UAMH 10762]